VQRLKALKTCCAAAAEVFFDQVYRHYGLPKIIISDRDPRFTGTFWQCLFKLAGTKLSMSTAYHPQSDGQTERANRTLVQALRSYVSSRHDDWDNHLPLIEFAYNNTVNASTGFRV
jgi:transposase InsO family protein